jgi:protocatechuate 3,4-dioxygenase beta subunit
MTPVAKPFGNGLAAERMSRRRALSWLGGLGLVALLPGCAGDDEPSGAPSTTAPTATDSQAVADCVLSPELTEGPFYLDLDLVREDITEDRPGLPLELQVNVVDVDACAPIGEAAVDVWHCDAEGVYSGTEGEATTFLRGIQLTDADGAAHFRTIFPGWYSGRAVHLHVKVHLDSADTYTGQLFFDEDVLEEAYSTEPYFARGKPDTTNATDDIFAESGGTTIVALTGGADGYSGAVTLGVQPA